MKTIFSLSALLLSTVLFAQQSIDTAFNFQTDPSKKLSLYIPSSYNSANANPLMLGLHPWNTGRWNSESWRDTLISFAESNGLILLCPDGGSDGQVDDPIDIDFTNAMMDSIVNWYNIDSKRTYIMGFSWGGKTTYIYGLQNTARFCGFMPIGNTANIREVAFMRDSVKDKPIYIIHGSNDSPNDRFTPFRDAMVLGGGVVNSNLLSGVGHTIDFPNRNQILGEAYQWIDSVCTFDPTTSRVEPIRENKFGVFPNPVRAGMNISFYGLEASQPLQVFDSAGKLIQETTVGRFKIPESPGTYLLAFPGAENQIKSTKLMVRP